MAVLRLLAAALGACTVLADLPVHCLYGQTVGKWNFKQGPESEKGIQETCGHDLPDSVMTMPNSGISYEKPSFEVKNEFSVTLEEPNIAKASDGRAGTWTMVYDEGFELNLGGEKIFHFFKYTPKTKDADEAELTDFNSHCHTTFSGWVTNSGKTSCVIAQRDAKSGHQLDIKAIGHSGGLGPVQPGFNGVPVESPEDGATPEVPCVGGAGDPIGCMMGLASQNIYGNGASEMRFGEKHMHHHQLHTVSTRKKFHEDDEFVSDTVFIEMINSDSTKTWRAKAHKHFEGRKMQHMMKMLGQTNFKKNAVHQVRAKASTTTEETLANYPKELNWHTKDDGAYATPVASQGSCGSCYAIAATDTANMKRRILAASVNGGARFKGLRSSPVAKPFSVQTALSCSDTNQGCEGGYPLLSGKYFSEVGLVEEGTPGCADYNADDEACNWDCMKDKSKVFKAKDYQYVGGYYGNGNEEGMVKAMQSGPVIIALNAPSDLFYYGEGTYSAPLAKDADQYNVNGVGRWEKTNHAVVGVGYGEGPDLDDSGKPMKYWMIKNSWGESWGQNGFFKMKRGTDDAAVESMAVQFELCDPEGNCTGNKEAEGAPAPAPAPAEKED